METLSAPNLMSSFHGQRMDVQSMHRSSILGSLLSIGHLEDLGRAVRAFLTPGQAQDCVDCVLEALRKASAIQDPEVTPMELDQSPLPKSRRNEKQIHYKEEENDGLANYTAMSFSLVARTVAIVLPNLPFHTLPPSARSSVITSVDTFSVEVLSKTMRTPFELLTDWRSQILLTATLRVRHAFATSSSLRSIRFCQERYVYSTFSTEALKNMLPELVVEVVRLEFVTLWNTNIDFFRSFVASSTGISQAQMLMIRVIPLTL